jgi:hypothetical protein
VLCLLAFTTARLHAAPLPLTWRWSNPKPHGNDIFDFAAIDGNYVQVCDRGRIYVSDDLAFWRSLPSPTTRALRAIAVFQNQVIITGENGTALRGDLVNGFSLVDLGTTDWLEGVAASPTVLVAVGDNAAIYTSSDGANWQRRSPPFSNWLRSVAYGSGRFVTVGETGLIATSSDGVSWARRSVPGNPTAHFNKVAWLHDRFWVASDPFRLVGRTFTALNSTDGTSWQAIETGSTNSMFAVAGLSDGTRLLAGEGDVRLREGANGIWVSEVAASKVAPAPVATYYNALAAGTNFLIGGRAGLVALGNNPGPSAGFNWFQLDDSFRVWLWDVMRAPNFYIAVGDPGIVMTSDDGIDWALEVLPPEVLSTVFLGVGGTINRFVAVGSAGAIIHSADGATWTVVTPRPVANDLQGVTALGDLLVVTGGGGAVLTSSDGASWVKRTTPTANFLSGVTAFPGGLVAVGDNGTILTSADGTSWTARASGTANWIYRVRHLGERLIAVGQNGTILTSTNGTDWKAQASGTTAWLNDSAYIDRTWFVIGNNGTLLASTNATDWTHPGTITDKSLFGLATNNGQLLAVGLEGAVLRSQVVPHTTPVNIHRYTHTVSNGEVNDAFLFVGQPDQTFTLEKALDLTSWTPGPTLELQDSSGTLLYLEVSSAAKAPPTRFHRTRLKF